MGKANDCGTCHDACPCRMAIVRELIAAFGGLLGYAESDYESARGCLVCRMPMTAHRSDCWIGRAEAALDAARKAGLDAK